MNFYGISKPKVIHATEGSYSELLLEHGTENMKTQVLESGVSTRDIHHHLVEGPGFIFSSLYLPQRQSFLICNDYV